MPKPSSLTKRAIIVEDDQIQMIALKMLLEDLNFEVFCTFCTGEEALDCALSNSLDLIVTDIRLNGEINGFDMVQQIRTSKQVPVIFITGQNRHRCMEMVSQIPNSALVIKPFVIQELKSAIKELEPIRD